MTATLLAGLGLALASAAALNWSYFSQHSVASTLPPLTLRRPVASLRLLFGNPRWLVGWLVGIGGWVLYVAALALAPLSLVQAASAGGIGLLALLVARGRRLASNDRRGVLVSMAGLGLLAASLGGSSQGSNASALAVGSWVVVSLGVAAVVALGGASGLGAAAGILYAAGDVATKAAVHGGTSLAFVALQLGFQRGGALETAGVATLLTNALPIAAGTLVFGEGLGSRPALRLLAFACTVVGATLLARKPAPELAGLPSAAGPVRFD